jgi:large subunit ribosomal protein L4
MSNATLFTKTGTKATGNVALTADIFGLTPNHDLIGLAYKAYLANGRIGTAKTLTRAEVSGGGKKPWRQKGTGRARFGSSRVPQWRHGGIVWGNTGNENYSMSVSKTAKRVAIAQALSLKADANVISFIETFDCADGKVKPTAELLTKIGATGNILIVVESKDAMIDRATRNITGVIATQAMYLNVFDIMNADSIIMTKKALELVEGWLGKGEAKVTKVAEVAPKPAAKRAPKANTEEATS